MLRLTELRLPIDHPPEALLPAIAKRLGLAVADIVDFTVFKRSYDARKAALLTFIYTVDVAVSNEAAVLKKLGKDRNVGPAPDTAYRFVAKAPENLKLRPVVVGFGPCGIFAALLLAQMGFRPIVLERGKAVRERTQDTWGLWRKNVLNPESNVQFGEGGAGTFSDGKLYSQIKDPRHLGRKVLAEFVKAGAPEEILYIAKPHIGTFRLVGMVEQMRAEIIALGGEIRFQQRVVGLEIERGAVRGVQLADGETIAAGHVVLALGHSARDTFEALHGRVVTNGMSQYSRNERNANAGIVVNVSPEDFGGDAEHPLAGIEFQRQLESRAFELGGGNYDAPVQLVGDFLAGRPSTQLGSVEPSYKPGVHLTDLATALPPYAIAAMREALPAFGQQIKGFDMADAVLTGVETRTSSPLRITRGEDLQSLNIKGLYPAGEGAGYAGGILSAGVDGIKVAEAVARDLAGLQ
ncbi:MAG: hypothetical protein IPL58_05100 [Betaproteobacteria bacterium]|uniref:FAD-dependent protein C-terminal domain-containing protein n=1 Tax=Candidatus Proximibacter danicus TaxID=2954365 RepID=A0A9D7PQZ7_9PROT|nr:hypothetical protein [Candidatus Proximibacter danicus]